MAEIASEGSFGCVISSLSKTADMQSMKQTVVPVLYTGEGRKNESDKYRQIDNG